MPTSSLVLVLALFLAACGLTGDPVPVPQEPWSDRLPVPAGESWTVKADLRVPEGEYLAAPVGPDGRGGVLRIEGVRGVTLDLSGVRLRGLAAGEPLDRALGWGIVVRDCEDVTIRGGELGGYRACLVIESSRRVVVEDVRFDAWFGQRLLSNVATENPADWLRPHENDAGEWIEKYGAAISVTGSEGVTIRGCRGRHGQNGILLTSTRGSRVYDNDFSFLSGWGLGMYRASGNTISHNIFDYCVRGYSHDVYWRGQDSAGILMFERCSDNVVAFNSATHSGDGVFVFAGQDLVEARARERGELDAGGCDRNLFYGNDLRYSVANSLEATFSSENLVIDNDLSGSHQHGIWGGYSNKMVIARNRIDDTIGGGVTIEHGQDCVIAENEFTRNRMGVELYWDPDPHLVGGNFGKHNDTSSRGHWIVRNAFASNDQDLVVKETTAVTVEGNSYTPGAQRPYVDGLSAVAEESHEPETVRSWLAARDGTLPSGHFSQVTLHPYGIEPELLARALATPAPDVPGTTEPRAEKRGVRTGGLETIVIGEWGPWDHRSGESRPELRQPGGLLADVPWDAAWFRWTDATDPSADVAAWRALARAPALARTVTNWRDPWTADGVREAIGASHFGLIARTTVTIEEAGRYRLATVSDDGIRVLIDGATALEDWTWHAPKRDEVEIELASGEHEVVLEYFQIDGAVALSIELERIH
ncbi:MAG: hypothetical protein GY711_15640 [bacterium]|nr:hypothetical protein [bacterium]